MCGPFLWPIGFLVLLSVAVRVQLYSSYFYCNSRSINMLIDRGEHVLSPAVAPVSTTSYACVRLCVLPRYLDALVQ